MKVPGTRSSTTGTWYRTRARLIARSSYSSGDGVLIILGIELLSPVPLPGTSTVESSLSTKLHSQREFKILSDRKGKLPAYQIVLKF